jgi:hypothetical protein
LAVSALIGVGAPVILERLFVFKYYRTSGTIGVIAACSFLFIVFSIMIIFEKIMKKTD